MIFPLFLHRIVSRGRATYCRVYKYTHWNLEKKCKSFGTFLNYTSVKKKKKKEKGCGQFWEPLWKIKWYCKRMYLSRYVILIPKSIILLKKWSQKIKSITQLFSFPIQHYNLSIWPNRNARGRGGKESKEKKKERKKW